MQAALQILLTLVDDLLPTITGSGSAATATINKIILALIQIIPLLSTAETAVVTAVQTMISSIETSGAATPAQLTTLKKLDAQIDAYFETAVSTFSANHPDAGVTTQAAEAGGLSGYTAPVAADPTQAAAS